eukprot:TRINITY_DN6892_c0_g1_i1.p1 TRINITY_DN6892_c0_g1~~TRINITY_DN6892_c0_g1_i1.p1  ORF type:complete len:830 (+),score=297.76 TRINITY_DN6892_c0_g1_i1:91-2490(+)
MAVSGEEGSQLDGVLTYSEVAKHNTASDLWCIIDGKVYDLTAFASEHPGGAGVVIEQAGKDCTKPFLHAHPTSIMLQTLGKQGLARCLMGSIDSSTVPKEAVSSTQKPKGDGKAAVGPVDEELVPNIQAMLNLHDFEAVAQRVMVATGKKQAWDYYSSGADDELTYNENVNSFQRIWLKPRILVNVREVKTQATMLGARAPMPVYLSAVAMCGMGHADGECAWMRAAAAKGVPFMIPNLSSKSFEDIVAASSPGQDLWYQMYVNPDRSIVTDQLRLLESKGVQALCITVDSAVPGKRERDLRNKIALQLSQITQQQAAASGTKARKAGSYANRDAGLSWDDIAWFQKQTSIPIVIKGVQEAEDAVIAARMGCRGVILSNHGGRNLDTARSGIECLPEVMAALREEGLDKKIEVFVDGGVRRGTDIIKAVALGAKGVGLGKPAVYSMSAYGQEGIERMLDILQEELTKSMQLCGAPDLAALNPRLVNAESLGRHTDLSPIPPSPYVMEPAPKNVRNPPVPEQLTPAELRQKIADLRQQLHSQEDRGPATDYAAGVAAALSPLWSLIKIVLGATFGGVFASSYSGTLHRSAVFLTVYVVVHMFGNLLLFGGPGVLNEYARTLHAFPLLPYVEAYLLLAAVVHGVAALHFTKMKWRTVLQRPLERGKLFFTSIGVVFFIAVHVQQFKFADVPAWKNPSGAVGKDLYSHALRHFADPAQVGFYIAGVAALGVHLYCGWAKTVLKMPVPDAERVVLRRLGQFLVFPVCIGFAACVLYAHGAGTGLLPAPAAAARDGAAGGGGEL